MDLKELDKIIAEKIFGWTDIEESKSMMPGYGDFLQGVKPGEVASQTGYKPKFPVPKYSSDIAAAWEVVDTLRQRGITALILLCPDPPLFRVDLRFHLEMDSTGCVTSDTAPHAICLAALKAVLVDVSEWEK